MGAAIANRPAESARHYCSLNDARQVIVSAYEYVAGRDPVDAVEVAGEALTAALGALGLLAESQAHRPTLAWYTVEADGDAVRLLGWRAVSGRAAELVHESRYGARMACELAARMVKHCEVTQ